MSGAHVVLGTGAIGLALVDELVASGRSVRAVNRSGRADVPAGVEVRAGDLADAAFAGGAVADATVIYQCLNPAYHRWAEEFPGLQDAAVRAARSVGARLVSFENTYMYGDTNGEPMTETTPMRAHTRKGKVRAAMQGRGLGQRVDVGVRGSVGFSHGPHARLPGLRCRQPPL